MPPHGITGVNTQLNVLEAPIRELFWDFALVLLGNPKLTFKDHTSSLVSLRVESDLLSFCCTEPSAILREPGRDR
jgi:hypothetical protein